MLDGHGRQGGATSKPRKLGKPTPPTAAIKERRKKRPYRRKIAPHATELALGVEADLLATAPREWAVINKAWTESWYRQRLREYLQIHGYVSAGVTALLKKAAEAYADSDYWRLTHAGRGSEARKGHADRAKTYELSAFELAVRESKHKDDRDSGVGGSIAEALIVGRERQSKVQPHRRAPSELASVETQGFSLMEEVAGEPSAEAAGSEEEIGD